MDYISTVCLVRRSHTIDHDSEWWNFLSISFSARINSKWNSNVSDLINSCSLLFLLNRCIVSPLTFTSISNPYPSDTSNERKIENLYRPATEALKMLPSLRRESKVSSMITFENCNRSPCLITDLEKSMKIYGLWQRLSGRDCRWNICHATCVYKLKLTFDLLMERMLL